MAHAEEMVHVLSAEELYRFPGGQPPTLVELRSRYERQSKGHSPDGTAGWLNWIIRDEATKVAIGFVQATVTRDADRSDIDMAWLVTPAAQGAGAATEAAQAALDWLRKLQPRAIEARIQPGHVASERVAERLGFSPTSALNDGETVWQVLRNLPLSADPV